MIAHYGYRDASGQYYISVDTDLCSGCGDCVEACPYGVLEISTDLHDPFREQPVAAVTERHRNKIGYSCAPCKGRAAEKDPPCVIACRPQAIRHSW